MALICANLYPQKQKVKEDALNKQENLINSSKQTSPTIKKYFDPRGDLCNIPKLATISDRVELMRESTVIVNL